VIPKFIRLIRSGNRPTIYGDGTQSRDFTHVSNVVAANLLACTAEDVSGRVFNIACGEGYTLIQLVEMINRIAGTKVDPVFAEARPGDVKHSAADIGKAKQKLGFRVLTRFEQGLADLIKRMKV
jgi:nucleoside-diphosphate-sugar epimerase